jgi:hypothetical protein
MIVFDYDSSRWNFRPYAASILGTEELERLHELPTPDASFFEGDEREILPLTLRHAMWLSDRLRAGITPEVEQQFATFMSEVLSPIVGRMRHHQQRPVFRVHLHGSLSISKFHRDREKGQSSSTLNLWLPLTAVWDSNSIWIESTEGANDHRAVSLRLGQALIFEGADLSHGSIPNTTGSTRVSCDIRFRLR